ncbi:MAG TPA: group 1 truncated hemoglobin [Gemmataceae bacterium]|nr:group 1 truncated hemoglobin [Gemmataceae bacterium]
MRNQLLVVLGGVVLLAGCAEGQKPTPLRRSVSGRSLYDRLGGEPGIIRIVDDFVANVAADEKIKEHHRKHFQEGDVAGLKKKLADQIGEAAGGPQKYTGRSMKEAHQGLAITNADFDALVADLVKAMDNNKVGPAEKKELLDLFEKMRPDVLGKPE